MKNTAGCGEITGLLALYRFGELDAGEMDMVREHIASCASCGAELAGIDRVLAAAPPVPPTHAESMAATGRVMARITARRGLLPRLAPAFAALALIVGLIAVYATGRFTTAPVHTPAPQESMVAASNDAEMLENMDVLNNMDVLEEYDTLENIEQL